MSADLESAACKPCPVAATGFNPDAVLPYGCTVNHIQKAMADFIDFLGFINAQVHTKGIPRMESMLMPANFSSMVGEFISANIPKYCLGLVKNKYHNGHPDLIPSGKFPDDAVQHSAEGIEIKASRYESGWQGHNPETFSFWFSYSTATDPWIRQKGLIPNHSVLSKCWARRLARKTGYFQDGPEKAAGR